MEKKLFEMSLEEFELSDYKEVIVKSGYICNYK